MASGILSPYTVTLGDEFQGVAKSLAAALKSILHMEDTVLERSLGFRIRYVLHQGIIETRLNRRVAHGMLGPGLTRARALLEDKRRGQARFRFDLPDKWLERQLARLFQVIDALSERWRVSDSPLIRDMLANPSNTEVGARHGMNRSQVWKRRRTLLVEECRAVRGIALDLAGSRGGRP
jgi:hypothetical protein